MGTRRGAAARVFSSQVVLGVDAATSSGWAIVGASGLLGSGVIRLDASGWLAQCERVMRDTQEASPDFICVVESGRGRRAGYKTLASLNFAQQIWRRLAIEFWQGRGGDARVFYVTPAEWRRQLFGTGTLPEGKSKEIAIRFAEELTGKVGIGDDEAEAICIAKAYLARRVRRSRKVYDKI